VLAVLAVPPAPARPVALEIRLILALNVERNPNFSADLIRPCRFQAKFMPTAAKNRAPYSPRVHLARAGAGGLFAPARSKILPLALLTPGRPWGPACSGHLRGAIPPTWRTRFTVHIARVGENIVAQAMVAISDAGVATLPPHDDRSEAAREGQTAGREQFPVGQRFRGFLPADAERSQVGRRTFSSRPRLAGLALCGARVEHGERLTPNGHTNACQFGRVALRGLELELQPLEILVAVESVRAIWDGHGITCTELRERVRKPDGSHYPIKDIRAASNRCGAAAEAGFGVGHNYPGMCAQGRFALDGLRGGRSAGELRLLIWPKRGSGGSGG